MPGTWLKLLVIMVFLGVALGLGISGVFLLLTHRVKPGTGPAVRIHKSREFNYQFTLPTNPWELDDDTRAAVKANLLAMKRTDPNAWLALAAYDYKTRSPRDAELVDEVVRRLRDHFRSFEYTVSQDEPQLASGPARRLIFRGEVNQVIMSGECYFAAHDGIGYWFMTWAPAERIKEVFDEFSQLRKGFAFLKERDGWTEKRASPRTFKGKQAGYSLRDTDALWEAQPDNADNVGADLYLQGKDRIAPKDVDKMAVVMVFIMNLPGDLSAAVTAAKEQLLEQHKKDYPETTILDDPEKPDSPPASVGAVPGRILRLRLKNGAQRHRFVMLFVVRLPDCALAIQCECDLNRRNLWEEDFAKLINSFRLIQAKSVGS